MKTKTEKEKPDEAARWIIQTLRANADEIIDAEDFNGAVAGDLLVAARTLERRIESLAAARGLRANIAAENETLRKALGKLEVRAAASAPAPAAKAAPPVKAAAGAGAAKCKHKDWDTSTTPPTCKACGKAKSARGRKNADPAANVQTATVEGTTKIDPPSLPLPLKKKTGGSVELTDGRVVDLADVDEFEQGTLGGSR